MPPSIIGSAMFSTAGSSGSSCPDWKTKPKAPRRSLVRSASLIAVRLAPRKATDPPVGLMMPASECSSVDLPEPDGPMTATLSPSASAKLTWFSARVCMPGTAADGPAPTPVVARPACVRAMAAL